MLWLIFVIILFGLTYYYLTKPYKYWLEKGIEQEKPVPFLGNNARNVFQKISFAELMQDLYNKFPNNRYFGFYQFSSPALLIRDPDLIKQLTIKDFDHFVDHRSFAQEEIEPVWGKNLFSLKGEKWRNMRITLSPSFTSGKMKTMFFLMSECAENFAKYFHDNDTIPENKDTITLDMFDVFTRCTNDIIATTAFGVKCDSFKNKKNEFYLMGKDATSFDGFWKNLRFMITFFAPNVAKFFRIKLFNKKIEDFFVKLVKETIKIREEKNIIRPDMIHLLMETRKGRNKSDDSKTLPEAGFATVEEFIQEPTNEKTILSDIDITAQALVFFFAGFETVTRAMCFVAYELAVNEDIQKRLRKEVDDTFNEFNGKITYEAIAKMKYLDMIVSEGIRKWPNAIVLDRVCVKPYTIEPTTPEEKPLELNIGDAFWVPVFAIHRDPNFYPNPNRFDPERFNDENKSNIKPYTYLPFGIGPRSCIGSRFALLEIKTILFHILTKFELVPVEKTQVPMQISKKQIHLSGEKGFWLGLKRRVQ